MSATLEDLLFLLTLGAERYCWLQNTLHRLLFGRKRFVRGQRLSAKLFHQNDGLSQLKTVLI